MSYDHGRKVPRSRFARLSTLGGLAAQVAGNVVMNGALKLGQGQSPKLSELLLTPKNIENLASKLAHLRGAAMKVGQLLSMDAGDLLPEELSLLLSRLRSDAHPMSYSQLTEVLKGQWGEQWLDEFSHFETRPFASASIGQVHRAYTAKGEPLAVKVQYPGVRQSISSDVDNVASLLKLSGLVPEQLDLDPLFEEAKLQLLAEADYLQEAAHIEAYRAKLNPGEFIVPEVYHTLSGVDVLSMSYVEGIEIDQATDASQAARDKIATQLIGLFMRELFDFQLMQTDPNFANYLYQAESDKVVLLDFGATRAIPKHVSQGYLALIKAGIAKDKPAMLSAARDIGFFQKQIDPEYLSQILKILSLACEPLGHQGAYDFGASDLAMRIRDEGNAIQTRKSDWHTPPVDALFIHRKLAGVYLLASKLKARVEAQALFAKYG